MAETPGQASDQFQYIKLPDGSYGKFAADATDEQIRGAVTKDFPDAYKSAAAVSDAGQPHGHHLAGPSQYLSDPAARISERVAANLRPLGHPMEFLRNAEQGIREYQAARNPNEGNFLTRGLGVLRQGIGDVGNDYLKNPSHIAGDVATAAILHGATGEGPPPAESPVRIPGVNARPSIERIMQPPRSPYEPPAPAQPNAPAFRPSIERIMPPGPEPDIETEMRLGTANPPAPEPVRGVESKLGSPEEIRRIQESMMGRDAAKRDLESGRAPAAVAEAPPVPATNFQTLDPRMAALLEQLRQEPVAGAAPAPRGRPLRLAGEEIEPETDLEPALKRSVKEAKSKKK